MLSKLRSLPKSPVAKFIVIGLIAVFALWGISDILFSNNSQGPKSDGLSVGDTHYSRDRVVKAINLNKSHNSINMGKQLSEAQQRYIEQSVINNLIVEGLIRELAKDIGLKVTDDMVKLTIAAMPEFQSDSGFDKERLDQFLKDSGISHDEFVEDVRNKIAVGYFYNSLKGGQLLTNSLVSELLYGMQQERCFDVITLPFSLASNNISCSEEELSAAYEDRKDTFFLSEKRSISYLVVGPDDVKGVEVKDEELKKIYEQYKNIFVVPEGRKVYHLRFPKQGMENAKKALLDLRAGKKPQSVADRYKASLDKEDNVIASNTNPHFADAIFDTSVGEYSNIVKSQIGYHIFGVISVRDAVQQPFSEVRGQIKEQYIKEKKMLQAVETLQSIVTETERGESMESVAKKYKITVHRKKDIDVDKELGDKVIGVLKDNIFNMEMESPIKTFTSGDQLVMVRLDRIKEKELLPYHKVKKRVNNICVKNKKRAELLELGERVSSILAEGSAADVIKQIKELSVSNKSRSCISHQKIQESELPADTIYQAFKMKKDELSSPVFNYKNDLVIVKMHSSRNPAINTKLKKALVESLTGMLPNEVLASILEKVRKETKIKVNL